MRISTVLTLVFTLLVSGWSFAESREDVAWKMIKQGALVVDVRTDQEFVGGHLDDAILIPHQHCASVC
ncbi:rhodanese-like domain-containing protein [Motiliproteus sp. MSK22-1]|uniref:rhodanese-like domain-containing protein n=1 Tax=Motiliproteus sp. MSK22-1 TaxID=1897630 RepID=UPI0018E9EE62|nr:rhodanese-like domain-containing protein [Motiliproteus sp. MSK22-1]